MKEIREECGVFGVYSRIADDLAVMTYHALFALQHRGQESAGIAVSDGDVDGKIKLHKGMGLVGDVFKSDYYDKLAGSIAVGHVRYATAGGRTIENAQPFLNTYKFG